MSALVWASRCGRTTVLSKLLKAGADPNIGSYYITSQEISQNSTALRWASTYGFTVIMGILLNNGADPNARETSIQLTAPMTDAESPGQTLHSGVTPLIAAIIDSGCNEAATALLLKAGADANLTEESGASPLIWAAAVGSRACIDLLLNAGAHVEHVDRKGVDAEEAAKRGGFMNIAVFLQKAKLRALGH